MPPGNVGEGQDARYTAGSYIHLDVLRELV